MDTEGRPWGDREGRGAESRSWRRQERDLHGALRAGGPRAEEGFGVAGDGGRGGKGRGGRGGRTKPCMAAPGLPWPDRNWRAWREGQSGQHRVPERPARGPQGWPADCWQWHPRPSAPGAPAHAGLHPTPALCPPTPRRQEGRRLAGHVASRIHIAFPDFCSSQQGVQGN